MVPGLYLDPDQDLDLDPAPDPDLALDQGWLWAPAWP